MPLKAIFVTNLTDTWDSTEGVKIGDKPGDIRWERDSDGWKCYKCCIFDNGGDNIAAIVGMAAYYFDGATTGYTTHTITMDFSSADSIEIGAGIFLSIPADGDRCWVQIKGFTLVLVACFDTSVLDAGSLTGADAAVDGELSLVDDLGETQIGTCIDDGDLQMICDFPF